MSTVDVRDHSMVVADGRVVAWTECGPVDGVPVLRMPGTPGCRWTLRADRSPWTERSLRVITTERPGFGASSRLAGRGFSEHASDVAKILDHLDLARVWVYGASGAAPHILAFSALYPQRVRAVTVLAGAAPVSDVEAKAETMIPVNVRGRQLARARDVEGLRALLEPIRSAMLDDPLAGFRALMAEAPQADQNVMSDSQWQEAFSLATREALICGVDGWIDETLAVCGDWNDVDPDRVSPSVTWWHTTSDRNAPLSAAERLVARLPNGTLHVWPEGGHLTAYHREPQVLDEMLARG